MTKPTVYARAETQIKVPFHDVDAAQIAWHGHYAKYFEVARCELLDSIDYNYTQMGESGFFWPVIDMHVRYINAARFGQEINVAAAVTEWENRLRIDYKITDAATGQRLTKGYTVQVAVSMIDHELQLASPAVLAEKLGLG